MIRGTTPTLTFTIPFDTKYLAEAFITLAQNKKVVLEKSLADCTLDGNLMSVRLTQAETLELESGAITEIQLRVRTLEGEALASDIIVENTKRVLKDGEI